MRAIITVVGVDSVGILADVSAVCARMNAKVVDLNQTVMRNIFNLVMLVDIDQVEGSVEALSQEMDKALSGQGLVYHVMHEDIFNAMHRI